MQPPRARRSSRAGHVSGQSVDRRRGRRAQARASLGRRVCQCRTSSRTARRAPDALVAATRLLVHEYCDLPHVRDRGHLDPAAPHSALRHSPAVRAYRRARVPQHLWGNRKELERACVESHRTRSSDISESLLGSEGRTSTQSFRGLSAMIRVGLAEMNSATCVRGPSLRRQR